MKSSRDTVKGVSSCKDIQRKVTHEIDPVGRVDLYDGCDCRVEGKERVRVVAVPLFSDQRGG